MRKSPVSQQDKLQIWEKFSTDDNKESTNLSYI